MIEGQDKKRNEKKLKCRSEILAEKVSRDLSDAHFHLSSSDIFHDVLSGKLSDS